MADQEPTVWVTTDLDQNGKGYRVSIAASDDVAKTLTPDVALKHAYAVLQVAQQAAYDAAVMKQLTHLGVEHGDAARLIADMREDRPAANPKHLAPLELTPGVSAFTGEPFIHVGVQGEKVGQWDFKDAQHHALAVLGAVAAADLDSAYLRMLSTMDLGDKRFAVVNDVGNFRTDAERE